MITFFPFFHFYIKSPSNPSNSPKLRLKKNTPNQLGLYIFLSFFPCTPTLQLAAGPNWSFTAEQQWENQSNSTEYTLIPTVI